MDDTNSEDRSDATHIQLQLHSSMQLTERPNGSAQETNSFSLASARENNSGHAGSIANDDMGIEKEQALPEDFKENSTELRLQNSAGKPQFYFYASVTYNIHNYCPQPSCGKVMLLHLSVSHSVHPPPPHGHCSGCYAFYWNAFLLQRLNKQPESIERLIC